ncbi:MAG: hypothetical protein ACK49K_11275, partial [Bacteroidota bacterium]
MSRLIFLFFFCFSFNGMAQEPLSMNQYLRWVAVEHPAIKEAKQRWLQSQNLLLIAKGNFDPSLNFAIDRKKFDGKNY